MTKATITTLSGLDVTPQDENEKKTTGLYVPQLSADEINALDASIVRNGGLVYDTTANKFKAYQNGGWVQVIAD